MTIMIEISKEEEFYRRTAVIIPAPISPPSTMKRRSKATTFLNDVCTCFPQTDGVSIFYGPIKDKNSILPIGFAIL
jgi:hypothetical protein